MGAENTSSRPDIPSHMRRVKDARPGAKLRTMRLPIYLLAEHVLTTNGLGGEAEIIGLPGDVIDGNVTVPNGKVRAAFVFPLMNSGERMTEDDFWEKILEVQEDLDRPESGGKWVLYPPALVSAYHGAKQYAWGWNR